VRITVDLLPEPALREQVLLIATDFAGYKNITGQLESAGRRFRGTYDDGLLEIIMPGRRHHRTRKALARLLEIYGFICGIEVEGYGSTTFDSERMDKGLEPDECYLIGRSVSDEDEFVVPDLAIETDVTRSSVPRQPVYAALGVPEVWVWAGTTLRPMRLIDGAYQPLERSGWLPALDLDRLAQAVLRALEVGQTRAIGEWTEWLESRGRA
jgi:Uma2 family endonuclease